MHKARCVQQMQWKHCNSQKLTMAEQSSTGNVATISKLAEYDISFSSKVRSYYLRVVKQVWFVDLFAIWNTSNEENNDVNYAGTKLGTSSAQSQTINLPRKKPFSRPEWCHPSGHPWQPSAEPNWHNRRYDRPRLELRSQKQNTSFLPQQKSIINYITKLN